jgi:hypothetical protein
MLMDSISKLGGKLSFFGGLFAVADTPFGLSLALLDNVMPL